MSVQWAAPSVDEVEKIPLPTLEKGKFAVLQNQID
jgi:hypothetical protein